MEGTRFLLVQDFGQCWARCLLHLPGTLSSLLLVLVSSENKSISDDNMMVILRAQPLDFLRP